MALIRPEVAEDVDAIRWVNEQAFNQENEAKLVEKLSNRGILTISLVTIEDNKIVGHIAFSPVKIEAKHTNSDAIVLAPMAVLPAYQNKGIGSQLVRAGLEECKRLGYELVILVGHPNYYPRFGFVLAKPKGLKCEFEVPDETWMVLELREGALAG